MKLFGYGSPPEGVLQFQAAKKKKPKWVSNRIANALTKIAHARKQEDQEKD